MLKNAGPKGAPGMPEAGYLPIPAKLARAGVKLEDCAVIKTHNPFAVNDLYFARTTGIDWRTMNNFGCSLVWGHPQAPMGARAIIDAGT